MDLIHLCPCVGSIHVASGSAIHTYSCEIDFLNTKTQHSLCGLSSKDPGVKKFVSWPAATINTVAKFSKSMSPPCDVCLLLALELFSRE